MTILDPERTEDTRSIVLMVRNILERIIAGYELAGVPLPERRYTTVSTPVSDCEQLVVVFRQAFYGPPGDEASEPQKCDGPRSASVEVHMTRCVPTMKQNTRATAPAAEDIQRAAELQMQDAWLLLDLAPITESWNGAGPGGLGVIATVEAGEVQGAYRSVVLNMTMAIP